MGQARRRKLSGDYPEKTEKRETDDNDTDICVCCNTRKIIKHLLRREESLIKLGAEPIGHEIKLQSDNERAISFDFGIVTFEHHMRRLTQAGEADEKFESTMVVRAFGEEVLTVAPDSYDMLKPGAWVSTIHAIREQLDERFGPVEFHPAETEHHAVQ